MTGGLVLAAGAGTRFGPQPKLLAELRGRPVLEHAIRAQCAVRSLDRVVVVLGARADELLDRIDFGRAEPVVCEDWEGGMAASLQCGGNALRGAARVLVTLGDSPTITPDVIVRMLTAPGGARAVYHGRPGHPAILGPVQLRLLPTLQGDEGARALLGSGPLIECSDLCSGLDVDTTEDLEEIRHESETVV